MILWGLIVSITPFSTEASVFELVDRYGNEIDGEDLGLLLYLGGTVCDDHFDDTAADAICKEMNYGSAIRWTTDEDFGFFQTGHDIKLDDVRCDIPYWESCTYSAYFDNCFHSEDVFLSCSTEGIKLMIRNAEMKRYWTIYPPSNLHDGITSNFAHSFDEYNGMWVRVNLAYRSNITTILIHNRKDCCQSRIVGATVYIKSGEEDVKKCGTITYAKTLYSFNCEEKGDSVEIRQEGYVNQWNIAEIEVYGRKIETSFKLVNRYGNVIDGENLGLLLYRGGTVCDDDFDDIAADAICRNMNYGRAIRWTTDEDFGNLHNNYDIKLDDVNCDTNEWESCSYSADYHNCDHNEDVFLSCSTEAEEGEFFTLVDRWGVEFQGEDLGLLLYRGGTVCDDSFDDTAADAICKTMNYAGAIRWTTSDADFGHIKYDYQITLDDVTCSRTEWTSCTYNSDRNDCSHSEDVQLSCRTHEQADEDCFTDYKSDTGWFPDSAIIEQSEYVSESECLARCQQFPDCKAAVLSPEGWSYRECFIVSTSEVTWRSRWSTAFMENSCSDELFSIVDKNGKTGVSSGLLLYKGGTVCPETFSHTAADFICSLLGYENERADYWSSYDMYGMYERTLNNVYCDGGEGLPHTCTFSADGTCYASDDLYLQCTQEKKSLSPGYVVLIVAVVIAAVVGAIYFFRKHKQSSTSEDQHDEAGETISNAATAAVSNNAPPPPFPSTVNLDPPPPNPLTVNLDPPNENIYETRFEEPAPALGTDNLPPPQYVYYETTPEDAEVPSYEEVMANDHVYQKPG